MEHKPWHPNASDEPKRQQVIALEHVVQDLHVCVGVLDRIETSLRAIAGTAVLVDADVDLAPRPVAESGRMLTQFGWSDLPSFQVEKVFSSKARTRTTASASRSVVPRSLNHAFLRRRS